jgi:hypothetical protein
MAAFLSIRINMLMSLFVLFLGFMLVVFRVVIITLFTICVCVLMIFFVNGVLDLLQGIFVWMIFVMIMITFLIVLVISIS